MTRMSILMALPRAGSDRASTASLATSMPTLPGGLRGFVLFVRPKKV